MGDADKKYVPEGVFLVCDKGDIPTQLICDPHPINIYSVKYADETDNKPILNIQSFGTCKTLGACAPPPGFTWIKVKEDVRLHGSKPLLDDSECLCPSGLGKIKIFFDEYEAYLAAENNSESGFVSEPISSMGLGVAGLGLFGPVLAMLAPDFTEGVGRGIKKGAEGTWNFLTHDMWQAETWQGMGRMAVVAGVYGMNASNPMGTLQSDMMLRSLDNRFGTSFVPTRDALATGIERGVTHAVEDVRRGNWGEVGESVGQIEYAVAEAVVGSKGAGLAVKGATTATRMAIGAERLARIAAASTRVMQRIRNGVSGLVKVVKRIEIEPNTLGTTGGNIRLRPIEEIPMARRNARLAGSTHPRTGVPFDERGYPIFESTHDVNLPQRLIGHEISDNAQFRHATENLRDNLNRNPNLRQNFTERQLQQIDNGEPTIDGYTWHHHQDGTRLQLVDRETHRLTGHDGGRRNTGGRP